MNGSADLPAPPPPAPPDVWALTPGQDDVVIHYMVRHPWKWVLDRLTAEFADKWTEVETSADLPSVQLAAREPPTPGAELTPSTPATRRRRQTQKKPKLSSPATLRIELSDPKTGDIYFVAHGTSAAMDGLEDKDELVRTIQRCRCENLNLSPPSILISWDVSFEECLNLVGKDLPRLDDNQSKNDVAVLKEPMGSQGRGIYFVKTAEEIHKVIDEHHQRALKEPKLLDNLIAAKGRIPSWGEYIVTSLCS